jgi:hypothetical protein
MQQRRFREIITQQLHLNWVLFFPDAAPRDQKTVGMDLIFADENVWNLLFSALSSETMELSLCSPRPAERLLPHP